MSASWRPERKTQHLGLGIGGRNSSPNPAELTRCGLHPSSVQTELQEDHLVDDLFMSLLSKYVQKKISFINTSMKRDKIFFRHFQKKKSFISCLIIDYLRPGLIAGVWVRIGAQLICITGSRFLEKRSLAFIHIFQELLWFHWDSAGILRCRRRSNHVGRTTHHRPPPAPPSTRQLLECNRNLSDRWQRGGDRLSGASARKRTATAAYARDRSWYKYR